jgi:hypothetical protein
MGRKRALAPYPAFSLHLPFSLTVDEAFALSVPKPFRLQQKNGERCNKSLPVSDCRQSLLYSIVMHIYVLTSCIIK